MIYLNHFQVLPLVNRDKGQLFGERLLLAYQNPRCQIGGRIIDDFAIIAIFGLAALFIGLVLVNLIGSNGARPTLQLWDKTERQKYKHKLVCSLETHILPALVLGAGFWAILSALLLSAIIEGRNDRAMHLAVIASHVGAFLTVAFVLLNRRIRFIRVAVAQIADIAGFWPVVWHPLAGRSYRPNVIAGINEELNRAGLERVVLVGHSQGSVICAWIVAKRTKRTPEIHLITCGSPLHSLYEIFFPNEINKTTFQGIDTNARTWVNFWRSTDPIATYISLTSSVTNVCLQDPRDISLDAHPKGHSDYWTEPKQMQHAADCLSAERRFSTKP
jgi:hypothetical protein